jgi:hypothetical protein
MTENRALPRTWIALTCGGLVAVGAAGLAAISAATATAPAAVLETCWALFLPRLTAQSLATLALGALASAVLIVGAASVARGVLASRRLLRRARPVEEVTLSGERVRIVPGRHLEAYTAGLLRPQVHLSASAYDGLGADELDAVIAHEAHHRRRRDPLRLLLARALADAFFFVPGARTLGANYGRLVELRADGAAIGADGSGRHLARALLRFADHEPAVGAGIAPERVDQLAGRRVRLGLPLAALAAGLAAVAAVVAGSALVSLGGPDHDAARLPGFVERACVLARALLPLATGGALVTVARLGRRHVPARA